MMIFNAQSVHTIQYAGAEESDQPGAAPERRLVRAKERYDLLNGLTSKDSAVGWFRMWTNPLTNQTEPLLVACVEGPKLKDDPGFFLWSLEYDTVTEIDSSASKEPFLLMEALWFSVPEDVNAFRPDTQLKAFRIYPMVEMFKTSINDALSEMVLQDGVLDPNNIYAAHFDGRGRILGTWRFNEVLTSRGSYPLPDSGTIRYSVSFRKGPFEVYGAMDRLYER